MTSSDIVVGLDDSQAARAALEWAAEQARTTGGPLRVVHVIDPPLLTDSGATPGLDSSLSVDPGKVTPAVRNTMARLFDKVSPEASWQLEFSQGQVGRLLVELAQPAALLVLGRGEHVGLGRLLIGSTSHYCLSHAECPVVAVPAQSTLHRLQQAEESVEARAP
ncbi:MAG TPA: universal stress protein [Propionibacteriaceae bacterium]|nr:universal stress protein [Propionibacteriaceae bacterium]